MCISITKLYFRDALTQEKCLYDCEIANRGKRIMLIPRKVVLVVAVNIASHDALIMIRRERRKPTPVAKVSVVAQA